MLSLQIFTRQNVDVALARKEMEQVAQTLRLHFVENPDALDRIISEDAFLKLNEYPNVIAFFPENVRVALTMFNLFSVFNLMRSIDQLNVDSALLAAYMISMQDWNSIRQKDALVQQIGASIVDVDTAAAIFVNDAPLCSRTVSDMIASIRSDIESLKRTHIAKLNSLDQIVQQEIQSTEKDIQDSVDRAIQTTKSWSNIISKFSYVEYVIRSINPSVDEKRIMAFISRFGNAIYASYLSREVPILTDALRAVAVGRYKHEYPDDLLKAADKYELSSVLGNTSFEMHTLVGRRWLMYSLDKFQLQEESQQLDNDVLMIRQKVQDMLTALNSQNLSQIMNMFDETLPQFLLLSTIGTSAASEDINQFRNELKVILFEYFKITDAIQEFIDGTKRAIETNGLSVVDYDMFSRLSDLIAGCQQYKSLVDEFYNSELALTAVNAYRRLIEDDTVRFDITFYGLLFELNNSADIGLVQSPFRFERIVTYSKFNPKIRLDGILSLKFKKEDAGLRQTDQSFYVRGLDYYPLVYVYGYTRAFLFFASKYPNAFAEFIGDTFNINLRNISSTSFILNAIFPADNIFRYGFSALNKFINVTDDYVDGIKNYFACMYIYRNYKSVNFAAIPPTNVFYDVLSRYVDENVMKPNIGDFFNNINPPSSWSDDEFLEIVGKTTKAPKLVSSVIYFSKNSNELDRLRPVAEHKTIAREIEKETNFRLLSYNQSYQDEEFVKRTFLALDELLGGTISPKGDIILKDACVYVNQAKERFFSVLFACVFVYIRIMEDEPQYPGSSILTMWMLLESHFNSAGSTQSRLSDVILSTLDNEETPSREQQPSPFAFETVWDIATRFIRVIQFHKFKPRTIESVLLGGDGFFKTAKIFLWKKCSEEHKRIISSWINVRLAYYHTQLDANDVSPWIDVKRILFLMNDHAIASTIYGFHVLDIQTETARAMLDEYAQDLKWPRISQQQQHAAYAIRNVNDVDAIQRLEVNSVSNSSALTTRELSIIQAYAGIQQISMIFELFQMLAFDEILHKMSRRVIKEKNDALDAFVVNFSQNEKESRNIMEYFNDETSSRSSFYPILLNLSNTAQVTISDFLNVLLSVVLLLEDEAVDLSNFQNQALFVLESDKSIGTNALSANKNQITSELLTAAILQLTTQLKIDGQDVIEEFKQNVNQTCTLVSDVIYTEHEDKDAVVRRDSSFFLVEMYMNMLSTLDYTEENKKRYEELFDSLKAAYMHLIELDTKTVERYIRQLESLKATRDLESYTTEASTLSIELQRMLDPAPFKASYDTSWLVEARDAIDYMIEMMLYLNAERHRVETNLKVAFKRLCNARVSPSFIFSRLDTDYSSLVMSYFDLFGGLENQQSVRLLPNANDLPQEYTAILYFAYETQTPLNKCIWGYHHPFYPPYVSVILTLRQIETACAIDNYAGVFAFSLAQIRQEVQQDLRELISANLQDEAFATVGTVADLRDRLMTFTASIMTADRYTPIQVIWSMTLKELINDLKEQSSSVIDYITTQWRDFVFSEYNQSQLPLKEKLEQITVRFITALLKEKWASILETKLEGDSAYTVFVEDNILLTQYGIHGELAALIKAQNK
jgi:hypothetical protein